MSSIRNVFIASEVRSGSTYLAESIAYTLFKLNEWNLWDLTKEHFSSLNQTTTPSDLLQLLNSLYTDSSGFRTAKIMVSSLSVICAQSHIDSVDDAFFGDQSYWIILLRENLIRQAISLSFARQTGIYHEYEQRSDSTDIPSMSAVKESLHAVQLSKIYLMLFAERCKNKLVLEYESFQRDPALSVKEILKFLNVPLVDNDLHIVKPKLQKTDQLAKMCMEKGFSKWLLQHHHQGS